jgi:hypothetical protein
MSDLTGTQRAALGELLARCSTAMLAQVDSMAAALPGAKARALRQLVAAEVQNRDRRELMLAPLEPLFHPRADGLKGLGFPPEIRARLWSITIMHEPEMLRGLDRGDQVSRAVADRLCLTAAMEVRDHPDQVWQGATEQQIEDLAGCLDLAGILRRHLGHMEDWLRGGTAAATADLKFAMKQASSIGMEAPARLLEILFAHSPDARYFLRLLGQVLPLVGREPGLEETHIHDFIHRLLDGLDLRCTQVAAFNPLAAEADLRRLRDPLQWASDLMAEFDAQTLIRPDAVAGRRLRQARQNVSEALGRHFLKAEQVVLSLLPVKQTVMAGKMKRPLPQLDQALDEAAVAEARGLLGIVALSRGPATVFGRESDRRQTAEGLTWRLASWSDEALERLNEGMVDDEALAGRRIGLAADLLAQIEAREAARSIRRRLMALNNRKEHLQPATIQASPQFV